MHEPRYQQNQAMFHNAESISDKDVVKNGGGGGGGGDGGGR